MAILGGAGNVAGSNPAGTGATLNYIGEHCYGHSGLVGVTNAAQFTLLEFTTGGFYIVGTNQFLYASNSNNAMKYRIYMNDEIIAMYGVTMSGDYSQNETGPEQDLVHLIIPPHTKVKMTAENETSSSSIDQCAVFQGRIYE